MLDETVIIRILHRLQDSLSRQADPSLLTEAVDQQQVGVGLENEAADLHAKHAGDYRQKIKVAFLEIGKLGQRDADWKTLVLVGAIVFGRINEIASVRTAMKSEGAYGKARESLFELIPHLLQTDPFAVEFDGDLAISEETNAWKDCEDEVLNHSGEIYLSEQVRTDVVAQHHDDPLAGYFEVEKIFNLLQRKYYWPNPGNEPDVPVGMRKFTKQ
ncbi:hypothetical protein MMC22_000613 [Lobaria immixta]|nr:hypothetical protein [Lobaria immixta]